MSVVANFNLRSGENLWESELDAAAAAHEKNMLTLYDCLPSGNGCKVRLLLEQVQIPLRRVGLDLTKGETRTPEFPAKFPTDAFPRLNSMTDGLIYRSPLHGYDVASKRE